MLRGGGGGWWEGLTSALLREEDVSMGPLELEGDSRTYSLRLFAGAVVVETVSSMMEYRDVWMGDGD